MMGGQGVALVDACEAKLAYLSYLSTAATAIIMGKLVGVWPEASDLRVVGEDEGRWGRGVILILIFFKFKK